jgi:glycosyltransferase involved in cell wall biosynthesis
MLSLSHIVEFKQNISFNELKNEYKKADIFVFLTLNEGFGLPLVEAMSMGTPILTSDLPIHKEITNNTQIYANPYDVNDIKKYLLKFYNKEIDTNKLSKDGLKCSQNYTWEKYIKEIREVINEN